MCKSKIFFRLRLPWLLAIVLSIALPAMAAPVLSEIMAANKTTLVDRDGDFSDWIEIHNPDTAAVDLGGWYLTDNASNKIKWQFPAVSIPPQGYLIVFASDKNQRDPAGELHTNFALSANGEYLGLIQPDGATVASEFAPSFPAQTDDTSYGLGSEGEPPSAGSLHTPTPGEPNSGLGPSDRVQITPASHTFTASISVTLAGAGAGQVIRYEIAAPSPAGAETPEPTASSALYTGPIAIAASAIVRAAIFSGNDTERSPISTALFVHVDNATEGRVDTFSSRQPIMLLDVHGLGPLEKAQGEHAAWLQLFTPESDDTGGLLHAPTLATPVGLKVRGSTSADFPKKSYSIELHDDAGDSREHALLGLANTNDWSLISPWSFDPSYVRNPYAYALSNRIGLWAPRSRFVEVFFKSDGESLNAGHYAGLSLLTERIKIAPGLVAITPLKPTDVTAPAITGGYILKFDPKDDDEYGWVTDHGFPNTEGIGAGTMLVVASPKADKLAPAQRDYIHGYIQSFENALFADRDSGWATRNHLDYIDRASWIDFHLLQVLTKNPDGLARSAYFTKDRNGKLQAGPVWDFDRAMGSTDPRSERWDEWHAASQAAKLWETGWWGLLARDPDFMQAWIDRWHALRRDEFTDDRLAGLADTLGDEIDPEAAVRDVARWPENAARDGGSFRGEVSRLGDWVTRRAQWIDRQFVPGPVETTTDGARRIAAPPGAQIVYTTDGSDPRSPGGKVAATAIVVGESLTLADGVRYTVRIYDPAAAGTFPGSPWSASSVVTSSGGTSPGPAPAPQLINLATRGAVDADQVLLCGLTIGGGETKRYLVRAVGPTLNAFGVPNVLADPVLRILSSDGREIARNSDWRNIPNRTELVNVMASVGAFALPESNRDAAMLVSLPAGSYTMEISSEARGRGIVLAEFYALDAASAAPNLSTRGFLPTDDSLIGGITLSGTSPRRLLLRAIGPTLAKFGVTDALVDPTLEIYAGSALIASNDDWTFANNASEIATAAANSGAFALEPGTKDAAVLITVDPGAYTLQLRGKGERGSALLEVYEVR